MLIESTSLDAKHVLQFDTEKHKYWLNGELVPGATAGGAAYPKPEALIQWLIKQGIEQYKSKTKLKQASEIGTLLHDFAECFEKGQPFDRRKIEEHPDREAVEKAVTAFLKWKETNKDEVILLEQIVAAPSIRGAGKFDRLVRRDGKVVLGDHKTAKSIYISALVQVAGYAMMTREWLGIHVDLLEIVKFPKEAKGTLEIVQAEADGMTINGERFHVPGLFKRLESQYIRNLETWRFQHEVEGVLTGYYDKKWEAIRAGWKNRAA